MALDVLASRPETQEVAAIVNLGHPRAEPAIDGLPKLAEWVRIPRAQWQVSFMELALDFEAFTGRPLPPALKSKFFRGDMSLQEKGMVL